jgi:class 3 adenylate cyclase/predicted ATPase
MDISEWLRGLDLAQYEPIFRENAIDADILPELTEADLEKLGVLLGHRKRMLRAIAARAAATPAAAPRAEGAERRHLTVMFCDLVGSTALSARLDPEDLREVLGAYHAAVAAEVERFGGFVARYMGDGVLIYFGYPQAHENDVERALHAGLALVERIARLHTGEVTLAIRIGIATGLVVVGDMIGSGEAQEWDIVGETPNLASRLQEMAEPNTVVVGETTRRLVGDLFECRDLGFVELKGLTNKVSVSQVLRPSAVESRFEALRAAELSPLVGREEETDLLLQRWRRAKNGHGQLVLISGEAGIGKSRLALALQDRLQGEPHTRLSYSCSPYHRDSALYPFITQLERVAGFARDDAAATRLDKLEHLLAQVDPTPRDTVALLADLLGLSAEERYPPLPEDPKRRRELTLLALIGQLESLARQHPVLLLFEDAHWSDSTSLELLDRIVQRLPYLSVLLAMTCRPEYSPPWLGQPPVTELALNRLGGRETIALVDGVARGKRLPAEILDRIVERTDGIPLFVEELTKSLIESGLLHEEAEGYVLSGPLPPLAIPSSLQASLMARLDRLAPVKEVAQIGAAIGREFSYELLAAVARRTGEQLREALDQLTAAGLVFTRGTALHASFMFKHALVQDAAYSTMLRSQRQQLHARIGKVLEDQFPEIVDNQPEILAHHFTQAGLVDQAIEFWRRAGARSIARSAHSEAAGHFESALDLLGKLPPSRQRDERDLELTLALAVPLIAVHGFGSLRVEERALGAKELSDKLRHSSRRFAAQRVAWNSCLMRQLVPKTVTLARELVELAEGDDDPAKLAVAQRALGYSFFVAGELPEAIENLNRGIALADALSDREFAVYGEHPGMVCRIYAGQTKILMGFPETGAQLIEAAIAHARHEKNAHSLAWALGVAAHSFLTQHETHATARFASEAIDTAREHHLPQWLALGERCKGSAMHQLGDFAAGLDLQRKGVNRWYDTGAVLHTTHCEVNLVESFLREGRAAPARAHLDRARAHRAGYGEEYFAAEIDRLEALLLQYEQAPAEIVEEYLANSLTTARRQGARLLELRTATTLARVLAERDERRRAVDLLALVYGCFTEGFDTADLKEAKTLLDQLA